MHVVATAGHVDHGKSTLVRALTRMEPDRWAEEHRRGMTIDLGYAWTSLPSGRQLAFVDVPGHERFVTNMLAGVGPAPAAIVVVAADEGWMPQTAEHVAALDALGVRHGLLAVTRSDLADPEPARRDALARLARTSLGSVGSVAVSGYTGQGTVELAAALDRLLARLPRPDPRAPVRLWVDRAFTIRGAGTIVTGTLGAGTLRTGDRLVLAPSGRPVRVRGLESLKSRAAQVAAVARVAVNLRGTDRDEVRRGMALTSPECWYTTEVADVRLRGLAGERASDLPGELTLHIGSAAVPVRVRPLGADTARLTLTTALPLHIGDTALLREPAQHRVPAGVTVLDVVPPSLGRRGAARTRAAELTGRDGRADGAAELSRRGLVRRGELVAMGCEPPAAPVAGEWLADPGYWSELGRRLVAAVADYAARNPLEPGMPVEVARQVLGLPQRRLVEALLDRPAAAPEGSDGSGDAAGASPTLDGGRIYGAVRSPVLPAPVRAAVQQLRADLDAAPFRAPEAHRLAELGLTGRRLAAAVRAGALLQLADGIVLAPGADMAAAQVIAGLEQPFTAGEARRALDTTRRVVIPLLERLDREGFTEQLAGDDTGRRRCVPPGEPN